MTQERKNGYMKLLSNIRSVTHCKLVRVVLAVTLALPLGCSGGANDKDVTTETPLEHPETLRITVRNTTDRVQYLDNPGFWMHSASTQVVDFDGGYHPPPQVPALYTNQPSCQDIASGEWACGQHGDTAAMIRALAPGAEYSEEWDAKVWERSSLEGEPECSCMEPVKAPAGAYLVSFGVSSSVVCSDPSYPCEPDGSSSLAFGKLEDPAQLEHPVTWPEQGEVLIVLE
jgi:hypothetical protein